jgi:putative copper export protein
VITNNFVHDLATGVWFGLLIVMWRLASLVVQPQFRQLAGLVGVVQDGLFVWGVVALAVILLTGAARTVWYRLTPVPKELRAVKLRLLVVKHIILGFAFTAGTVIEYLWALRS